MYVTITVKKENVQKYTHKKEQATLHIRTNPWNMYIYIEHMENLISPFSIAISWVNY